MNASPDPSFLPRREIGQAVLLAALCALLFLRAGVLPTRAVVPFVPERFEPMRTAALLDGSLDQAELALGNVTMGDKYNQSLAWDRILQDRLRSGGVPAWSRDIAGGVPFVPQQAQVYQPWNLFLLLPIESAGIYGIWFLLHQVLFGLGAWWFLRRLGLAHGAALFGLTVAVLGLWTQARIHHNVILSAALPVFPLLTLVLGGFRSTFGPARIGAVGLLLGISWLGGFPPVALQVTYLTAAWSLFCAARFRRWRGLLPVAAGAALGAAIGTAQMVPTLIAAAESSRTGWTPAEFAAHGLSWQHLRSFLWPDLLHWPDLSVTAGEFRPSWTALDLLAPEKARDFNYAETAFSIGVPGLVLSCLALWHGRSAVVWFFVAVASLAFGLATSSAPFLQLSTVVPGAGAGDLRRFLFLLAIGLTVLTGMGAQQLLESRGRRPAAILALCALVACLPLALTQVGTLGDLDAFRQAWAERLAGTISGVPVTVEMVLAEMTRHPIEASANQAMLFDTSMRSLAIAAACLIGLSLPTTSARLALWMALGITELLLAGAGTIVPVPVERVTRTPTVLTPVIEAETPNGVRPRLVRLGASDPASALTLLPPNLGAFYGVEDLGAYEPLPAARMEQLFQAIEPDAVGKPSSVLGGAGVLGLFRESSLAHPLLDLLGCRFVLSARDELTAANLIDRTPDGVPRPFRLYERTGALPRATFCDRAVVVTDPTERLLRLHDVTHDPRSLVLLEAPNAPVADGDGDADADVALIEHGDELVVLDVTAREHGYLRLADPHDRGWVATVDGETVPIYRADHYLRALYLTPGTHRVTFRYAGPTVTVPRILALGACLVAFGLIAFSAARNRRIARLDGARTEGRA